ncbi:MULTISPECIES: type II secretion system protein [unclassified Granulicatella]|uniref:type II secretion system protein n=1 Tax=unclassified Granulicatella TaxID=2630493 RepID=UPI00142F3E45|nr:MULTISPECIES: type II secretion system protein [unclassified Granulicatella]MBF0780555.1 type II secretion system protein [Granulicatella sp. 19428wC4_WM01]
MKRLKYKQAFILLESIFAFTIISSAILLCSLTLVQFYQQENQRLQQIEALRLADSCVIEQKEKKIGQQVTIYYNLQEVRIYEDKENPIYIYMED